MECCDNDAAVVFSWFSAGEPLALLDTTEGLREFLSQEFAMELVAVLVPRVCHGVSCWAYKLAVCQSDYSCK